MLHAFHFIFHYLLIKVHVRKKKLLRKLICRYKYIYKKIEVGALYNNFFFIKNMFKKNILFFSIIIKFTYFLKNK